MILARRCCTQSAAGPGKGLCYKIYYNFLAKQFQFRQFSTDTTKFHSSGNSGTRVTNYLYRTNPVNVQYRSFSSSVMNKVDMRVLEKDAEKKIGWILKALFCGSASLVAYNMFPYLGETVMHQSVSLLKAKDPLFKRMGASRLARFAIDDEKRMKIVELGGVDGLLNMLAFAKDDRTRTESLKALVAICKSDAAATAVFDAGGLTIIESTPESDLESDIGACKSMLVKRFRELRFQVQM